MSFFSPAARLAGFLRGRLALVSNALLLAGGLLLIRPVTDRIIGFRAQTVAAAPGAVSLPARRAASPPSEGQAIGRLEIPRIGLDLAVFEGTTDETLRRGPGHLSGTSWPSAHSRAGNCVIAGHRDSFFRALEQARVRDLVRLRTDAGVETYRLSARRIVRPREVSVLAATADPRLTLVTCYPFRWWGEAPYRLVWHAMRIDERASAGGAAR